MRSQPPAKRNTRASPPARRGEPKEALEEARERFARDREVLEADVARMRQHVAALADQLVQSRRQVDWMERTRSWTLTRPLRAASGLARRAREWAHEAPSRAGKFARAAREMGALAATIRLAKSLRSPDPRDDQAQAASQAELRAILERYAGRPIIVAPPLVDWNVPLFQRPQQLALSLAQSGCLYFYCTRNALFDHYHGFVELTPGCFVTDQQRLVESLPGKTIHVSSTARTLELSQVRAWQNQGDKILYDYIDELHADISGAPIPRSTFQRHYALLGDEKVACVATASKLLNDVQALRHRNFALVTNGVDAEHFARAREGLPVPAELSRLAEKGRFVIGYYGALAMWFDYQLVRSLARARPDYEILLIGEDYDGSLAHAGLNEHPNITVLGPVPYAQLPRYAQLFDVSMIPFVVNEVTQATSPLKLFEYMALGTPIVTTGLAECQKYASCLIASTPEQFVGQVDAALARAQEPAYQQTLRAEAQANTWAAKAKEIRQLLESSFGHSRPT